MFAKLISDMMIKPGSSPVFGSPTDFGLEFEAVEFPTEDGVTLRGWLIDGGSDKVVVQTHFGVQCSRSGYSPRGKGLIKMWKDDISFLRQAKHLSEQGYSVLMYDMRNHGESERGDCPWISWGPKEAADVIAAVDFVTGHARLGAASIGLLSICMGAAATTYAYGLGQAGLQSRVNVKALMAVQPLHYREFTKAFGIPGFLNNAGTRLSTERLGFDLNDKTFLSDVHAISVPTLVVQNRNDPWTDLDFVQSFHDKLRVEKELSWLDLTKKRAAAYDHLGTSPEIISSFFGKHL
ncbi:MAG: alpha/beta fold hydrolase [Planctomycetota bacterium]